MRFFADADFPFISWRRKAYVVSAAMLGIGIGAMVYNAATTGSWLNYGVDFTGGTMVHVDFDEQVTVDQIREVNPGWQITRFGEVDEHEFIIRMPTFSDDLSADPRAMVTSQLETVIDSDFRIVRAEGVGPKVGSELQERALLAIIISFVLTLIYLAIRFEWRFGVASLVPTTHDILVTLGILALLRSEISVGTVAAFLTIVGYSLNDTIIIFDRIRENLAKPARGMTFAQIIDRSINETLPRTVLTTGTTLATLTSLYLFGGAVIRDFALVLILGIGIGTYSSIFVAAPALYAIEKKWPPRDKKTGAPTNAALRRETAVV